MPLLRQNKTIIQSARPCLLRQMHTDRQTRTNGLDGRLQVTLNDTEFESNSPAVYIYGVAAKLLLKSGWRRSFLCFRKNSAFKLLFRETKTGRPSRYDSY